VTADITRDVGGRPAQLWPIAPWRVQPIRERGELLYGVAGVEGRDVIFAPRDLLILRGPSLDGLTGHHIVQRARQAIGAAIAAETFAGASFWPGRDLRGNASAPRSVGREGGAESQRVDQRATPGAGCRSRGPAIRIMAK
jgi:hypothetical protein